MTRCYFSMTTASGILAALTRRIYGRVNNLAHDQLRGIAVFSLFSLVVYNTFFPIRQTKPGLIIKTK